MASQGALSPTNERIFRLLEEPKAQLADSKKREEQLARDLHLGVGLGCARDVPDLFVPLYDLNVRNVHKADALHNCDPWVQHADRAGISHTFHMPYVNGVSRVARARASPLPPHRWQT